MRPYTLRKGDTLETIAQKRGMSVDEIRSATPPRARRSRSARPSSPAGKLSKRDNQIIEGITKINEPRIYPTRKGESIMDIIAPKHPV